MNAERSQLATLLRDSAVILAGMAALAYVASGIYGTNYLRAFGVANGFQGVGVAHLAMLRISDYLFLGCEWIVLYKLLASKRLLWLVVGIVVAVATSFLPYIVAPLHGRPLPSLDGDAIFVAFTTCGLAIQWHRLAKPMLSRNESLREASTSAQARNIANISSNQEKLKLAEEHVRTLDETIVSRLRLGASDADLVELRKQRDLNDALIAGFQSVIATTARHHDRSVRETRELSRQLTIGRYFMIAFCGFSTVIMVLPSLAVQSALDAAKDDHFVSIGPERTLRNPVYWIGDREVYLTRDKSTCWVHVAIGGVEQFRRECPDAVTGELP